MRVVRDSKRRVRVRPRGRGAFPAFFASRGGVRTEEFGVPRVRIVVVIR